MGQIFFCLDAFLEVCPATAAFLIHGSFSHWKESPFTSKVTTKPISSLEFPKVTVCLPRNLGIALSYDLMKTAKMNLTDKQRETLIKKATKIFIHDQASSFAPKMIKITNKQNIENIFKGLQSIPIASQGGFKVTMHDIQGRIYTPGFNETFNAEENKTWNGTRLEFELDFKNPRKVIHPLDSLLVIEFTAIGRNKIEYSVGNTSLKTLDISGARVAQSAGA